MKFKHYKSDIKEIVDGIGVSSHKFKNKKILLVGANGFLGKYFVKTFEKLIEKQNILFSLDCYDNHISSKKSEFSQLSNNKYITGKIKDTFQSIIHFMKVFKFNFTFKFLDKKIFISSINESLYIFKIFSF